MKESRDITSCFKKVHSVSVRCVSKRMDGKEGRDWYSRYVWSATRDTGSFECNWEGFETVEECVEDMVKTLND